MTLVQSQTKIDRLKAAYAQYGKSRTESKLKEEAAGRVPLPTIERSLLAQVRIQKAVAPDRAVKLKAPLTRVDGKLAADPDIVAVIKKVERKLKARAVGGAGEMIKVIKEVAPKKPTKKVRKRAKAGGVKITPETIALSQKPSLILDKLKAAASRVRREEPFLAQTEEEEAKFSLATFEWPVFEWPKAPKIEWPDWSSMFKAPETPPHMR